GLAILGESPDVLEIDGEWHARAPRDLAESRLEALVGEERWIDAVRRRAELVERVVELGREVGESVREPVVDGEVPSELEVDPECDGLLLPPVVESAPDLAWFRRGRAAQPPLGCAQGVHRVEQVVFQPTIL